MVTSPEVEFYVAGQRVVLSGGEAWYIDFNLPHRLYNGGSADRIHLVIDCVVNDWMRSLFFAQNFEQFRKKVLDDAFLQTQFRDAPALIAISRAVSRKTLGPVTLLFN